MKLEGKDRRGNTKEIRHTVLNQDAAFRKRDQGHHEVRNIDTPEYQGKVKWVFERLKEGLRTNEIFAMMLGDDPDLGEAQFITILNAAYEYGENELHKDREYTFMLHMHRYEKIYNDCIQLLDTWKRPLDPVKDWHIITARYYNALKAMRSKEELLGLHDKSVVIEFNDHRAVLVEQEEIPNGRYVAGYDLDKLSIKEMRDLLELVQEARTIPIEGVQRVMVKTTKIEISTGNVVTNEQSIDQIDVVDVQFEEMPAQVVDKFEDITPIPEKDPLDEPGGIVIIDTVGKIEEDKKVPEVKGAEIADRIHKNTLEAFKEKLRQQKIGSQSKNS